MEERIDLGEGAFQWEENGYYLIGNSEVVIALTGNQFRNLIAQNVKLVMGGDETQETG